MKTFDDYLSQIGESFDQFGLPLGRDFQKEKAEKETGRRHLTGLAPRDTLDPNELVAREKRGIAKNLKDRGTTLDKTIGKIGVGHYPHEMTPADYEYKQMSHIKGTEQELSAMNQFISIEIAKYVDKHPEEFENKQFTPEQITFKLGAALKKTPDKILQAMEPITSGQPGIKKVSVPLFKYSGGKYSAIISPRINDTEADMPGRYKTLKPAEMTPGSGLSRDDEIMTGKSFSKAIEDYKQAKDVLGSTHKTTVEEAKKLLALASKVLGTAGFPENMKTAAAKVRNTIEDRYGDMLK